MGPPGAPKTWQYGSGYRHDSSEICWPTNDKQQSEHFKKFDVKYAKFEGIIQSAETMGRCRKI